MQTAAIFGRAEELKGEEETSIFGDGFLMGSQGRGAAVGSPPQIAVLEKPA